MTSRPTPVVRGPATARVRHNFLFTCDGTLVYFDLGVLALFDPATRHLVAKTQWRGPELDDLRGGCPGTVEADVDQTKVVHGWTIRARGRRFTVCRRH